MRISSALSSVLVLALFACTDLVALDDGSPRIDGGAAVVAFDAGASPDATIVPPDAGDAEAGRPSPSTEDSGGDASSVGDAGVGDADASDADVSDATEDSPDSAEGGSSVGPATYGGGRVIFDANTLVAAYWGGWSANAESDCESALEPSVSIASSSFFEPITQYWGKAPGSSFQTPIALPALHFDATHYANDPGDGGFADPDLYVESLAAQPVASAADPDTIYVVFYSSQTPLCAGMDGCSGLTPTAHVPYMRIQYDGDVIASSRAVFRELATVLTDSDGAGWSVPYDGKRYSISQICALANGGGGLGKEVTLRLWDVSTGPGSKGPGVFAADGLFSAASGEGRCVSSLATTGVLAAVASDGGASLYAGQNGQLSPTGFAPSLLPPATDVTISASPLGLGWHGMWTLAAGAGIVQVWPVTNDFSSSEWGISTGGALPAPYVVASAMDTALEGDGRWDAFAVGYTGATDAAPSTALLFRASYDTSQPSSGEVWEPFNMQGLAGNPAIISGPGATSFAPGRSDAFVLAATGGATHLLHTWCDARQNGIYVQGDCPYPSGWADLGAPPDGAVLVGDPDAASWPSGVTESGHYAVACSAADGSVRTFRYDNGVTAWGVLAPPAGVSFIANPTITGMGDGRYWTLARESDGAIWSRLDEGATLGVWTRAPVSSGAIGIDATSY